MKLSYYVLQAWHTGRKVAQPLQAPRHADAANHMANIRVRARVVSARVGRREGGGRHNVTFVSEFLSKKNKGNL